MKFKFSVYLIALMAGIFLAGCQNPLDYGTIEVFNNYTGTCQMWATVSGVAGPITIGNGSSYNFTNVPPGVHTLTLQTAGSDGSNVCGFANNNTYTATCSVTVEGGVLYATTLLTGSNVGIFNYTCPN